MPRRLIHWLWLLPVFLLLISGCGGKTQTTSTATPEQTSPQVWTDAESALSTSLLGISTGKCEWQMLGWMDRERYVWAVCTDGPGIDSRGASGALVVTLNPDNTVRSVTQPESGASYEPSLQKLFPPLVRAKILTPDFDMYTFVTRLEERWQTQNLPPLVYSLSHQSFPIGGEEAIPAVSAAYSNRISQLSVLGSGSINQVAFLPDGKILTAGSRGMRVVDMIDSTVDDAYGDMLQELPGFLSADGKLLAVISEQVVAIYEVSSQSVLSTIDTSNVDGKLWRVTFLPDGMTIFVEKHMPSEGIPEVRLAMYSIGTGEMTAVWSPNGGNYVLSPDGRYAVGLYNTIATQIWYLAEGQLWKSIPVIASAAAFSSDGQILALVELGKVKVFWVWDGFEIGRLEADIGPIDGLALSPDGKLLLTWSRDNFPARLWSVPDFQPKEVFSLVKGVNAGAFNADGSKLVLASDTFTFQFDLTTKVTGQFGFESYNAVWDIAFSPDFDSETDLRMAVLYNPGNSRSLVVNWDLATRRPIFEYPGSGFFQLDYLPNPYGLALGGEQGLIRLISAKNGNYIREIHSGSTYSVQGMSSVPGSPAQLAIGLMNEVRIFNPAIEKDEKGRLLRVSGGWVNHMDWNGCFLATGVGGVVSITDEAAQQFVQEMNTPYDGSIQALAILPDCSQVLAAVCDTVYRWETRSWQPISSLYLPDQIISMAVSPDSTMAAVGLFDGTLRLYNIQSGAELRTLKGHRRNVTALQFSPDSNLLASGDADGVVILWGIGK